MKEHFILLDDLSFWRTWKVQEGLYLSVLFELTQLFGPAKSQISFWIFFYITGETEDPKFILADIESKIGDSQSHS